MNQQQVLDSLMRNDAEQRINVLRLEVDYELMTLYEAIVHKNEGQIKKSKEKLENYRIEMLRLEV